MRWELDAFWLSKAEYDNPNGHKFDVNDAKDGLPPKERLALVSQLPAENTDQGAGGIPGAVVSPRYIAIHHKPPPGGFFFGHSQG
jgi:hypothetical protein